MELALDQVEVSSIPHQKVCKIWESPRKRFSVVIQQF